MTKVYYTKEGRRYRPVAQYDQELMDSLPQGYHLLSIYPGGRSTRFKIDPDYAAMIAATRVGEDAICQALMKATEVRPKRTPITTAEKDAWEHLVTVMGDDARTLTRLSARDVAEAAVQAMIAEADKLLSNPSVRKAYERFILVCELTKEQQNG